MKKREQFYIATKPGQPNHCYIAWGVNIHAILAHSEIILFLLARSIKPWNPTKIHYISPSTLLGSGSTSSTA